MRSVLACVMMVSALSAGGVQAGETSGTISVQSREGQAIVKKVVGLSQRLGLPNPFVAAEPELAPVPNQGYSGQYLPILTLKERVYRHEGVDGRRDNMQRQTSLARGAQAKLRVQRAELLSRLDLDAETRARVGVN